MNNPFVELARENLREEEHFSTNLCIFETNIKMEGDTVAIGSTLYSTRYAGLSFDVFCRSGYKF